MEWYDFCTPFQTDPQQQPDAEMREEVGEASHEEEMQGEGADTGGEGADAGGARDIEVELHGPIQKVADIMKNMEDLNKQLLHDQVHQQSKRHTLQHRLDKAETKLRDTESKLKNEQQKIKDLTGENQKLSSDLMETRAKLEESEERERKLRGKLVRIATDAANSVREVNEGSQDEFHLNPACASRWREFIN